MPQTIDLYRLDPTLIDPKKVDKFMDAAAKMDETEETEQGPYLKVALDATRSDSIVNGRSYCGPQVRKATPSFVTPYPKPVLTHHAAGDGYEAASDPIGRVITAKFTKYSGVDLNTAFVDAKRGSMGSGAVILTAAITDPDAQQKILDKRYLTVSTRQHTTDATCIICGASVRDYCTHVPGRIYDLEEGSPLYRHLPRPKGKAKPPKWEAYFLWDKDMLYKEVSFVNIPAQEFAGVLSAKMEGADSADIELKTDIYDWSWDSPGVVSITYSNGLMDQELIVDDVINPKPTGRYVSAPDAAEYKQMNTHSNDEPEEVVHSQDEGKDMPNEELQEKVKSLTEAKDKAEKELAEVKASLAKAEKQIESLNKANEDAAEATVDALAENLITMRQFVGHPDYPADMDADALKKIKEGLCVRDAKALSYAISDERPNFKRALDAQKDELEKLRKADEVEKPETVDPKVVDNAGSVEDPTLGDERPAKAPDLRSILGLTD